MSTFKVCVKCVLRIDVPGAPADRKAEVALSPTEKFVIVAIVSELFVWGVVIFVNTCSEGLSIALVNERFSVQDA